MKNIKVMFVSWHFETPKIFLDSILKMTPKRSGIWKNIEATLNPDEADYFFVMDGTNQKLPNARNKAIYFGEHPHTPYSPTHKTFPKEEALLKLPLISYLNPGEWWIPHSYDELMALNYHEQYRDKSLVCIMTYQTHHPMYAQRPKFVAELVKKHPSLSLDLFGRPSDKFKENEVLKGVYRGVLGNEFYDATKGEHIVGKAAIQQYRYSLEFDVGECKNYFSERFYDSLLLWTTPIYFGCTNVGDYLPHEGKAYYIFNQNNLADVDYVAKIVEQDKYWNELDQVRQLLLNKYQMFAYCHHVVNNIESYKINPIETHQNWIKS